MEKEKEARPLNSRNRCEARQPKRAKRVGFATELGLARGSASRTIRRLQATQNPLALIH